MIVTDRRKERRKIMGPRKYITPGTQLDLPGGERQHVSQVLFTGQGHAGVLRSHSLTSDAQHVVWDVDVYGNATVRTLRGHESDAQTDFRERVAELLAPDDGNDD